MALQLGDIAPDFEAETTEGRIHFHDWINNSWAVLFSHPKNFTPVCTTELGYTAKLKPEFERRRVKVVGLSVDPLSSHEKWADDIKDTQGQALNFPLIADPDRKVADLYGMIHPNASDTLTVRSVFVVGPDKKIKLSLTYPASTGRNFDEILRVIDSLQLTAKHQVANSGELEVRRGRDHRSLGLRRRCGEEISQWLDRAEALSAHRPTAIWMRARRVRSRDVKAGTAGREPAAPFCPFGGLWSRSVAAKSLVVFGRRASSIGAACFPSERPVSAGSRNALTLDWFLVSLQACRVTGRRRSSGPEMLGKDDHHGASNRV